MNDHLRSVKFNTLKSSILALLRSSNELINDATAPRNLLSRHLPRRSKEKRYGHFGNNVVSQVQLDSGGRDRLGEESASASSGRRLSTWMTQLDDRWTSRSLTCCCPCFPLVLDSCR